MEEKGQEQHDHRRIGQELDLFTFSDLVGSGLPLWTPKGTIVRQELDKFVWEMRQARGYERVTIPHITKRELYEQSGHWEKFADDLFKITAREGREYALKPMSCPHHTQIFARRPFSYREMPQRYAETTMVYRDEQSGELGGLTRVLSITQDDAHVFCREEQMKEEFKKVWDIVENFYNTFGFSALKVRLSLHDPAAPEKYLGTTEQWKVAEDMLRAIAKEKGVETFDGVGEAAFYGPKLDFMANDSLGRQWQVATIQLDMNLPDRFDLTCVNEKGEKERVVMIHAAITGAIERFIGILLEHLQGTLPTWLSPVQARILPIADAHKDFAYEVMQNLKDAGIRVEVDDSNETLGKKIREARMQKIPYTLVIGDAEVEAKTATLESRDHGKVGALSIADIVSKLSEEIKTRA
ncbi:MAG: threonine--tRNA ligase [bacterium]